MIFQKLFHGAIFVLCVLFSLLLTLAYGIIGITPMVMNILRVKLSDQDVVVKNGVEL